jgi:hypothetical protein
MKLHGPMTINGRAYKAGDDAPMGVIYAFFLVHMGIFGLSGFFMAYGAEDIPLSMLYLHGGIAILVYIVFYLAIFGRERVQWMFVNAALGLFGIWVEIDWLLGLFGRHAADFPWQVHVVPFLYYVLYTFLLWQMVLDITKARDDEERERNVRIGYVAISLLVYGAFWLAK